MTYFNQNANLKQGYNHYIDSSVKTRLNLRFKNPSFYYGGCLFYATTFGWFCLPPVFLADAGAYFCARF